MKSTIVNILIFCSILFSTYTYAQTDTISIFFNLASPSLTTSARNQLDSLAYYNILPPNKQYGIVGYADYLGGEESNITLSINRAEAVKDYLLGLGIRPDSIAMVTGKGEVLRDMTGNEGYPTDRRVDIIPGGLKKTQVNAPDGICWCGKADCAYYKKTHETQRGKWQIFFKAQTANDNGTLLKPGQEKILSGLCTYLKSNNTRIVISGLSIGNTENVTTSKARAAYIKQQLIKCGLDSSKIHTVSIGTIKEPENGKASAYYQRVDITIDSVKVIKETTRPGSIDISKLKENETINLENIFFLPGSHKITDKSFTALYNLYITMQDNPTLKINIEGHICCLTNTTHDGYDYDDKEYRLSENRARTVYSYLIKKGISKDRLNYEGFGIKRPKKWPERSLADENLNRRVEIRIIEK